MFTVYSDGLLQLNFGWLSPGSAKLLGEELRNGLPALSIPADFTESHVQVPIEQWEGHLSEFLEVLERVLQLEALPDKGTS